MSTHNVHARIMSTYNVYLARKRGVRYCEWDLSDWPSLASGFDHVAQVEANSIEEVFRQCQHATHSKDTPWQDGDHVTEAFGEKIRSLSTGDVIEEVSTGRFYRVDSFGFSKAGDEPQPA